MPDYIHYRGTVYIPTFTDLHEDIGKNLWRFSKLYSNRYQVYTIQDLDSIIKDLSTRVMIDYSSRFATILGGYLGGWVIRDHMIGGDLVVIHFDKDVQGGGTDFYCFNAPGEGGFHGRMFLTEGLVDAQIKLLKYYGIEGFKGHLNPSVPVGGVHVVVYDSPKEYSNLLWEAVLV